MIGARPHQGLTRGLGRNAFDLPVAALAGLAAAVIAFAMPADLLGRLVSATGLPHLLAAAEPPLGLKARAGLGIAGAAAAFGLAYMLLRFLDSSGTKKARTEPEAGDGQPRLRRRDLHPDAPVCRPISANRDFGEPAPPPLPDASAEPAPFWLPGREAEVAEPPLEPHLDDRRSGFRGSDLQPDAPARRPIVATPDSSDPAAPVPEPARPPAPSWLAEAEAEAAESGHEPQAVLQPEPEPEPAPEPQPVRAPAAETSIAELMRRLEQGLARRRTHRVFSPAQAQAPAPQVFPEANDDRLQSAIESLQRFAARGE